MQTGQVKLRQTTDLGSLGKRYSPRVYLLLAFPYQSPVLFCFCDLDSCPLDRQVIAAEANMNVVFLDTG